jgi:hypothetical protein
VTRHRAITALALAAIVAVLAVLAIGMFGSPRLRARVAADGPSCPFRAATGEPCAFCGMTHATLALGHGDLDDALAAHPLAPLVLAATLVAFALIAAGRGEVLGRGRRPMVIVAGIAVVWAVRLLG